MRENCTYGSMRGRAFPTGRPALLYTLLLPLLCAFYGAFETLSDTSRTDSLTKRGLCRNREIW